MKFWNGTLVFLLVVCVGASNLYHHCRRMGQSCQHRGTCNPNGSCSCSDGFRGIKCEIHYKSNTSTASCNPPCQNNGECLLHSDYNVTSCMCKEDKYYGNACEKKRAATRCEGAAMHISVVPYPDFTGLVLIRESSANSDCTFKRTMDGNEAVHTLSIDLASNACTVTQKMDTPSVGDLSYIVRVVIQNSAILETSLDLVVNMVCVYPIGDKVALGNNGVHVPRNTDRNVTNDTSSTVYQPVILKVQNVGGGPVPQPLSLGTPLQLSVTLADTQKFDRLVVVECEAISGGPTVRRAIIVDKGCVTAIGRKISTHGQVEYSLDRQHAVFNFYSFRFNESLRVDFACGIRTCLPTEACYLPTCGIAGRRRRRSDIYINEMVEQTHVHV